MTFRDRRDAGVQLATKLTAYAGRTDVVVFALPRGGVPVAFEVAKSLDLPLDIFIVRKLGVPGKEELAMGAIASGGIVVRNEDVINCAGVSSQDFDGVLKAEWIELARRENLYRSYLPQLNPQHKVCIIIDDGIATGASMEAAVLALRAQAPARIVVAAPVASHEAYEHFGELGDEVQVVHAPKDFVAVGGWYQSFDQASDEEVSSLLAASRKN